MQLKSILNFNSLTLFFISTLIQLTLQKITISSPDELARRFNYEKIHANFANFGKVLYGYNFMGRLHYDLNDKGVDYACKQLPPHTLDFESSPDEFPIVMVERGNCTFVTKARNVQRVGGLFALIVNNNDDDIDKIILSDDGTGSDIYIPTVLISKKDGEMLKKFMDDNRNSPVSLKNIMLSIEFRMPQRDRVEYQFFFNSASLEVYSLIKSFSKYQSILSNLTDFHPHYITHMSPDFDPSSQRSIPNCISKGLYCSSPRYDLGVIDGREIIYENIRQKCVYFISKGIFKNSFIPQEPKDSLYWRYMETFFDKCLNKTVVQLNQKCSQDSQEIAGLNHKLVDDCVMSSYAPEKDKLAIDLNNNNTILEEEYNVKKNWKIKIFPTIMVNNKTLKGKVNSENLLEAICAGLAVKPQVCYDESYFVKSSVSSGVSFSTVFIIVVIIILLNTLIYFVCRRYIMKQINDRIDKVDINGRINTVVTSYLALKDSPA